MAAFEVALVFAVLGEARPQRGLGFAPLLLLFLGWVFVASDIAGIASSRPAGSVERDGRPGPDAHLAARSAAPAHPASGRFLASALLTLGEVSDVTS
jgi:hypothetical protein